MTVQSMNSSVARSSRRELALPAWLPVAAVLLGAAWGSNQFTPMLLVYHRTLGLGTGTLEALFGVYALGLIPGLLVAGTLSDAHGRRPLAIASAVFSLAGSVALMAAGHHSWPLFLGRGLIGIGAGSAFSAGTAWLREVSRPPFGDATEHDTARRSAVAMTFGFAFGPLLSGLLAQWAGAPGVVPYIPHIVLMLLILVLIPFAPETNRAGTRGAIRRALPIAGGRRFRRAVAPMAPWVFAAPAIAFALLPSVVGLGGETDGIALTAAVTTLTALAGVLIQPFARRLDARPDRNGGAVGLGVITAGLALSAVTAALHSTPLLVPSALILGAGYGMSLVAGLVEVGRLADPRSLAGLTAIFYALTYLGFAAPYLLSLASGALSYGILLAGMAALALATATTLRTCQNSPKPSEPGRPSSRSSAGGSAPSTTPTRTSAGRTRPGRSRRP
jgi:hypothetical protein